jgi:hypothetical protein
MNPVDYEKMMLEMQPSPEMMEDFGIMRCGKKRTEMDPNFSGAMGPDELRTLVKQLGTTNRGAALKAMLLSYYDCHNSLINDLLFVKGSLAAFQKCTKVLPEGHEWKHMSTITTTLLEKISESRQWAECHKEA